MDDTRFPTRAARRYRFHAGLSLRAGVWLTCGWLVVVAYSNAIAFAQKRLDRPTIPESESDVEAAFEDEKRQSTEWDQPVDLDKNPKSARGAKLPTPPAPRRFLDTDEPDEDDLPGGAPARRDGGLDLKFLGADKPLVAVRVEGNETIPEKTISQHIRTRPDRPADERQIREDVRALYATRWFYSVEPRVVSESKGLVLIFQVLERPIVRKVEYQGRKKIKEKTLAAETGLRVGSPFDVSANREAARRLEQYYHEKGFAFATVELDRGGQEGDREVVFRIHEGPKVRVTSVKFDGNQDFSDALLATKLNTKKAILWLFGGKYDPATIPDDVAAVKQYYHSLGYFDVKIEHRVGFSENRARAHLEYIIEEGRRYKVRDIQFAGNRIFSNDELRANLKLTSGKFFNARFMEKDLDGIKGKYGETGRLFARIEAVPRFLATPGEADLVYQIDEDKPYRIGRINVHFNKGDDSHTKRSVVLNMAKVKSGDLANPKLIERTKRALSGSQLFEGGPGNPGQAPQIRIARRDDELESEDEMFRGQSDDFLAYLRSQQLTNTLGHATSVATPATTTPKPASKPSAPTMRYGTVDRSAARLTSATAPLNESRTSTAASNASTGAASRVGPAPIQASRPNASRAGSPYLAPRSPIPHDHATQSPSVRATRPPSPSASSASPSGQRLPRPQPIMARGGQPAPSGDPNRSGVTLANKLSDSALEDATLADTDDVQVAEWSTTEPRDAFRPQEPGFIFRAQNETVRAQNAFQGPINTPQSPLFGNSPQGDPFNDRLVPEQPGIVDLDVDVTEARTGRLMFGVGVNSDAGVVGSIVLTEQNFDILRPPTSFRDIIDGNAWRGAGQKFRLEAVPGSQVSRYMASWTDPFFLDTPYSLGLSGFFYNRFLPDWREERAGGRVTIGRQLTPQLSLSGALRLEHVDLSDPDTPTPDLLARAVGSNFLSTVRASVAHDTRDAPFLPGEGHIVTLSYEQAFGDFDYPRVELEASQYFTLYARPDGGGRHILTLSAQGGWTGEDTPIFERFFAGGFQTFRGFAFRGVGPKEGDVRVGGRFMAIGTAEYMFPVMANEMIQLVAFTDFGTVENDVGFDDFRVTVGGGLRVTVPAMGPVPLAFDWGIPVIKSRDDDTRLFSFYVGVQR